MYLVTASKGKMGDASVISDASDVKSGTKSWEKQGISGHLEHIQANMAVLSPASLRRKKPEQRQIVVKTAQLLAKDIVLHTCNLGSSHPLVSSHVKTMRRTVHEMSLKHEIMFRSMMSRLDSDLRSYGSDEKNTDEQQLDLVKALFVAVADGVFADKHYNWGRVVAVYAFGATLAAYLQQQQANQDLIQCIGSILGEYVSEKLADWIHAQGGWDSFDNYFPEMNSLENKLWTGLLVTAVGLGALATVVAVR